MSTKERLAAVLRAEGLNRLALNADNGMYDDFESQLATPIVQLVMDLRAVGRKDLAQRAIDGEWDGTKEEGDAWFEREGRALFSPDEAPR